VFETIWKIFCGASMIYDAPQKPVDFQWSANILRIVALQQIALIRAQTDFS